MARGVGEGPVRAVLWYQPIGFRWARNLEAIDAAEPRRFLEYYRALARHSAAKLAEDETIVK